MEKVEIDLTTPPRNDGKGKEEAGNDEKKKATDRGKEPATQKDITSVSDELAHLRKYMERMFGVAISYPLNATQMSGKGETIDWARGYGPTRLMEEIQFSEEGAPKYGGFDLHKENDDQSGRVKYVFKLPDARDKVLCVPYYLLAQQVQSDAYFIRYLNERLLPVLDDVCTDVSILSRAILGHNWVQPSLRKAERIMTHPETRLILNIPPVMFPVTPKAPKMVNRNVDVDARKEEVLKQTAHLAYREKVSDAAEELAKRREKFANDEVERLRRSGLMPLSGQTRGSPGPGVAGGGGGGGGGGGPVPNLPADWNEMSSDDKLKELAGKFYYVATQLDLANARCSKLERDVASADLTIQTLQIDVEILRGRLDANPFNNNDLLINDDDEDILGFGLP